MRSPVYYCRATRTDGEPCRNYRLKNSPEGRCRFHLNPEVVESLRRRREADEALAWAESLGAKTRLARRQDGDGDLPLTP